MKFVAAAAVAALSLSCRQVLGIDDYDSADAGAPVNSALPDATPTTCGLPFGTAACASCASMNCCAESTACAADPACFSYESCFYPCNGDATCWAQCVLDHPANTPAVSALSSCMARACETECALPCGAFPGYRVSPDVALACESCIVTNLCAENRACATSSDCDGENRCKLTSQTLDSYAACDIAHGTDGFFTIAPDGGSGGAWGTWWTARSKCGTQCGLGSDWSCIGHVNWLLPKSAMTTVHLYLKDYQTGTPISGADVSVCGDIPCATPFATNMSDPAGFVTLPFHNNVGAGLGLGLNGFFRITSPSIVPYYQYWGFPLSEAELYMGGNLVTPAELQQINAGVNINLDPARAIVVALVFDCYGGAAPGVTVTLDTADAKTRSFASSGAAATTTDGQGFLFFENVPAGTFQLEATPMSLGRISSKVAANARAGAITVGLMYPTP